jgi:hypothetical protein
VIHKYDCPREGCKGQQIFKTFTDDITGAACVEWAETCDDVHELTEDEQEYYCALALNSLTKQT